MIIETLEEKVFFMGLVSRGDLTHDFKFKIKESILNFERSEAKIITIEIIEKIIAPFFDVPLNVLKVKTRKREITYCRFVIWFFCSLYTKHTLTFMAKYYSLSHCDSLYGINKVRNNISIYEHDYEQMKGINKILAEQLNINIKKI